MRRYVSDASLTILSQGVSMVTIIAIQAVFAKSVSLATFGQVAAAQAIVGLLEMTVVSRGAEVALQFLGKYWGDTDRFGALRAHLLRQDIIYALVAVLIVLPLSYFANLFFHMNGWFMLLLATAIPLQIGYGIRKSLFIIEGRVRAQALFEIATTLCGAVISIPLILAYGAWGMISGALLTTALKNVLIHQFSKAGAEMVLTGADLGGEVRRAIHVASGHSVFRNLTMNASANVDILILTMFARPEVVAIYKVAKTLAGAPSKAASPLWGALRPRLLSAMRADDQKRYRGVVMKLAAAFLTGGALAIPAALLLGPRLLPLVYGPTYLAALAPLTVLLGSGVVMGAATGWLSFTLIISSRKTFGSILFFGQLALTVGFGLLFGAETAIHMAIVVAASSVLAAVAAWWGLFAGLFYSPKDRS